MLVKFSGKKGMLLRVISAVMFFVVGLVIARLLLRHFQPASYFASDAMVVGQMLSVSVFAVMLLLAAFIIVGRKVTGTLPIFVLFVISSGLFCLTGAMADYQLQERTFLGKAFWAYGSEFGDAAIAITNEYVRASAESTLKYTLYFAYLVTGQAFLNYMLLLGFAWKMISIAKIQYKSMSADTAS